MTAPVRNGFAALHTRVRDRLTTARRALGEAQEKAITGLDVLRPSDAPGRTAQIHRLRGFVDDQAVFRNNARWSQGLLDRADTTLGEATTQMSRARELAVTFSSEVHGPDDLAGAAREVESLRDHLIALSNTSFDGRHLFAGTAYDAAAFDDTGTWTGSNDTPSIQIDASNFVQSGFDGQDVFQGDQDVFQLLQDLTDALDAADHTAVAAQLGDIDDAITQLTSARQDVGYLQNRASDAVETSENLELLYTDQLDVAQGIDPTTAYSRLAELQVAYESALTVSARSFGTNLFQMLG